MTQASIMDLPKTMKVWQYTAVTGNLERSLKLSESAPLPTPKPDQYLVKIHYASLNPVDYKVAENPILRRVMIPNPATPGIDYSGTVVQTPQNSTLKPGDKVFGCGISPFAGGCLAEYAVTPNNSTVAIPQGVSLEDASTIGVAGLTAYQSLVQYEPKSVFLNGGSGGTGVFGIQVAKVLGCKVTTTCSSRNVEFCRELGADEVVDYTKEKLPEALAGKSFDHVVDNIMADPAFYWKAHEYSAPDAKFVVVGGGGSLGFLLTTLKMRLWPSWLGGGQRERIGLFAQHGRPKELEQLGKWMAEEKVKAVIDEKFAFKDVPKAFEKLRTGRARGKIVLDVSGEPEI